MIINTSNIVSVVSTSSLPSSILHSRRSSSHTSSYEAIETNSNLQSKTLPILGWLRRRRRHLKFSNDDHLNKDNVNVNDKNRKSNTMTNDIRQHGHHRPRRRHRRKFTVSTTAIVATATATATAAYRTNKFETIRRATYFWTHAGPIVIHYKFTKWWLDTIDASIDQRNDIYGELHDRYAEPAYNMILHLRGKRILLVGS